MIDRSAIVAALATVPGLTPSPMRPDTIAAGAAWPVWIGTHWMGLRPDSHREIRWYVYVVLNGTAQSGTAAEGDPLIDLVGNALSAAQLRTDTVEPTGVAVGETSETLPALRFTCH